MPRFTTSHLRLGFRITAAALASTTCLYAHQNALSSPIYKRVLRCDASQQMDHRLEPITKIPFPTSIPGLDYSYRLMGTGVRQVTFLRFNTYAIGIYVSTNDLRQFMERRLMAGKDNVSTETEQKWASWLMEECKSIKLRLVPARATQGSHLKNAFMKMLETRLAQQQKDLTLNTDEPSNEAQQLLEAKKKAIRDFGDLFPKGNLAKESALTLTIQQTTDQERMLVIDENGQERGRIFSTWLCHELIAAYMLQQPLVPALKADVLSTLAQFHIETGNGSHSQSTI